MNELDSLKDIPFVNFVMDFKGPGGYIPFGYTKHNFPIIINEKLNDIDDSVFVANYSSLESPYEFNKHRTAEFSNFIVQHTKNTKFVLTSEIKDNIQQDSIYLVVLESLNVNNMFEYYSSDKFLFEDFFSPNLLKLIKENENFKIVFMDAGEGAYPHSFKLYDKLYQFLQRNNITSKNKIIVSTNNNFIKNVEKTPEFKKFNNQIKTYCNNHLLISAGRFISQLRSHTNNSFIENGYEYSIQNDVHTNPRPKYFLMYNRNGERMHRVWFVNQLYKLNLLEKGFISFFSNENLDKFFEGGSGYSELGMGINDVLDMKQNYKKFNPLVIDDDNPDKITYFHNYLSRKDEYEKSYFTIVSETNAESDYSFITEKTIKPIMNLHPFVILGNPNTLGVLKSFGFKTFDRWWDESYDLEFDFLKRGQKLIKVVNTLCEKSHDEWDVMMEEMKETLYHNKQILHKLSTTKLAQKEFFKNILERII
jgi:hypothetical protein